MTLVPAGIVGIAEEVPKQWPWSIYLVQVRTQVLATELF